MALNLNFNFGQNNFGAPGCGCQGGGGFGMNPMGSGGFGQMGQMGGMDQMMAMNQMNNQMMQMFNLSIMAIMTQLMQMMMGGTGLSGAPGQFGGAQGGSPLNSFLGGGGGGGSVAGGGGGGGTATAPTTGGGAALGPADGSTTPSTQNFINKALSHQGAPYVFGAQGPNAFDCSGLVYYALKEAGVKGGRTTARGYQERYKDSKITRKEDLKPGDLVFFWSPNDRGIPRGQASHIEIYLGNGKTMGTDTPREGAKVEPINWDTFIGGARVPELQK